MPLRERDLAPPVAAHFEALGYRVFAEVGIVDRWADLAALGCDEIVAVELKLHAWREALRQAMAYQLGADRAYIALPLEAAHPAHRSRHAFEREGVGVLAVDAVGGVRTVLPAAESPRMLPSLNVHLRQRLTDRRARCRREFQREEFFRGPRGFARTP